MRSIQLAEASLVGVAHQTKGGTMRAQLRIVAVLSTAEQKKLHISLNGFKAVELDQEFEAVELKFIPPAELKRHQLALAVDRAARFKVREREAAEGKPDQQVLEFTAYLTGAQFEAVEFMSKMGPQVCRMELNPRQTELFDKGEPPPKKRTKDGKSAAAGKDE